MIVFTNGCFDVLHVGHIRLLAFARGLGDRLVVGLNSDESVRRLKGQKRPVNPEGWRGEVLSSIRYVDEVVTFDTEEDLAELIRTIEPAVLVKGEEYYGRPVTGSEWAGRIEYAPNVEGASTTNIVSRIELTPKVTWT